MIHSVICRDKGQQNKWYLAYHRTGSINNVIHFRTCWLFGLVPTLYQATCCTYLSYNNSTLLVTAFSNGTTGSQEWICWRSSDKLYGYMVYILCECFWCCFSSSFCDSPASERQWWAWDKNSRYICRFMSVFRAPRSARSRLTYRLLSLTSTPLILHFVFERKSSTCLWNDCRAYKDKRSVNTFVKLVPISHRQRVIFDHDIDYGWNDITLKLTFLVRVTFQWRHRGILVTKITGMSTVCSTVCSY